MTEVQENPYSTCTDDTMRPVVWRVEIRRTAGEGYVKLQDIPYSRVENMREQIERFNAAHAGGYPQYRIVTR